MPWHGIQTYVLEGTIGYRKFGVIAGEKTMAAAPEKSKS